MFNFDHVKTDPRLANLLDHLERKAIALASIEIEAVECQIARWIATGYGHDDIVTVIQIGANGLEGPKIPIPRAWHDAIVSQGAMDVVKINPGQK